MVWNVNTGAVIAALEDPWGSAFGASGGRRPDRPDGGGGGGGGGGQPGAYRPPVVGLAWATAAPSVLAVLLHPCILMLWDYRSEWVVVVVVVVFFWGGGRVRGRGQWNTRKACCRRPCARQGTDAARQLAAPPARPALAALRGLPVAARRLVAGKL
jgi:hypothetical protein